MPDNNYAAQGVPVQQPHYQPGPLNHINLQNVGTEGWSSELFDCMDDPMNGTSTFRRIHGIIYQLINLNQV